MPKGRLFAPSNYRDGIWFNHRGGSCTEPVLRNTHTSTGTMLSEPFTNMSPKYPPSPSDIFENKYSKNFKTSNRFSCHDNRHSHEDHGVYFGDGFNTRYYGRHLTAHCARQHHTNKDFLKHLGRHVINHDYHTVYRRDFEGAAAEEPPTRRRYPRNYKEGTPGLAELSTQTVLEFNDDPPYITETQVLANSQEPFLKQNKWKYSYHGLSKCYPALPDKIAKPHTAIPYRAHTKKVDVQ